MKSRSRVGNTKELAELLTRAETCQEYLADLGARVNTLAPLFSPAREEQAWADLISELSG